MKVSKLSAGVLGRAGVCVAALLLSPAMSDRAQAYGGFWSSQTTRVKQSAARIVFVDNPDSTVTAIVQMSYAGPSQDFAWVIPMPGTPTVGVSSNAVFERLDAATAPEYWVEVTLEGMCAQEDDPEPASDAGIGTDGGPRDPDPTAPVAVIDQGSVGPYDYVNITVDRALDDPAQAATDWLTMNGYDLTDLDSEVLDPYLQDGLNLLAFKLTSGTDAGAIRPVVLTYESKRPMIPIRPAAVAAQDDMPVQVWVFGPSQAVPRDYESLVLNDALIDWLTAREFVAGTLPAGGVGPFGELVVSEPSNYDAVVSAAADEAGGRGFVTELGGPASQYRDKVWSTLDEETFTTIASQSYADGIDAVLAAHAHYSGWDGWSDAIAGATTLPEGVTIDEFGQNPDDHRGVAVVDAAEFLRLLDESVVAPVADTAAMLYRAPYLTRLYSTISPDEMTVDPSFDYNADLAQVSNIHIARQFVECGPTLSRSDAPWRIEPPQGGVIVGEGSGAWPVEEGSLPANLKIVTLSSHGPGTVVEDNSAEIGMELFERAGTNGSGAPVLLPQHGVMIGGTQSVTPYAPADSTEGNPPTSDGTDCSVAQVGRASDTGAARAPWWPLAGVFLALRRRGRAS
jgi:hypothetical protein